MEILKNKRANWGSYAKSQSVEQNIEPCKLEIYFFGNHACTHSITLKIIIHMQLFL